MTDKVTSIPSQHLEMAKACEQAGDIEGWRHHMKLCHATMKEGVQRLRERVEQIPD